MKKMKKAVALLLGCVMLTSLVLCACNKVADFGGNYTSGHSETEEMFTAPSKLNPDNLAKAQEYCSSVDPKAEVGVPVYVDGIRGAGATIVEDLRIHFSYKSYTGDNFSINIDRNNGDVSISIFMTYGKTFYTAKINSSLEEIENTFDKICEDPKGIGPNDDSALGSYSEDIKKDLPIFFARMAALSDSAFTEIGIGLKDLGVDLGDKYRNIDPKLLTSKEVEITNEHKFENGICTDCGIAWTKYYLEVVEKFSKHTLEYGTPSTTGQESASMISPADEVKYTAHSDAYAGMYYHHLEGDKDIKKSDWCSIYIDTNDSTVIDIQYQYEQKNLAKDGRTFSYYLLVQSKPGEVDKVFESKESFKDSVKFMLTVFNNSNGVDINNAFNEMKEEDIRQMLENEGLTFYTKDEIVDRFWNFRETFFTSLDNGMVWMKTSLKDFGFNWK